ncbi:MAG: LysM peptidoglycan-binding domain-containing protein [Anaerolineales bacterium]|nr:LysM peptidoglycan-binding domain-containing protein [Anaerolineales bacterium]
MVKKYFSLIVVALVMAGLVGNSVAIPAYAQADCDSTYTVQADDWLSRIADRFLGDVLAYPAIVDATNAAANADESFDAIRNADVIEVGQVLCIPASEAAQASLAEIGTDISADEAQPGGTLKVAFQNEWAGLDPHTVSSYSSYQILNNVLEGLTFYDNNLNLVPWLAESWEQSEDGLTWTFHLREGVMFTNGREMTAEDVKWSFERLIDPATGAGNAARVGPPETQIEVIDDYTVAITHPEPFGIFPQSIGFDKSTGIVAKESVNEDGIIVEPIGTGPFQISEVEGTTRMVLTKNENYWQEGLPYLDAIEITPIPDDTVRETALLSGDVDWVLSIAPQNYESLEANPDVVVSTAPQLSYDYMGINLTREPFTDVRVRQAIALALDREEIAAAGYFGLAETIEGPTGPGSPWYFDYAPYGQDIERAKELLAEAGYPDGFEMELLPTVQYGETVRAAQVIQQQLAAIGITASINAPEWSQWLELEGNFNYDAYICNWNGLIDADQYYYLQHKSDQVFNFTGYDNPEFDELVTEARSTSDFDERYQIYQDLNQILVDDAPYIYMYNKLEIRAYSPQVKGFVTRSDQANNFWTVWLDQSAEE